MSAPAPAFVPPAFVLPGDVDDATVPSGGNTYDRRTSQALAAVGRPVREFAVAGTWPRPDDAARARLAGVLGGLPDGAVTVLDGLVACGVPELVVPQAGRLRLMVLVHLPLAGETGLAPALAAELDARERETLRCAGPNTSPLKLCATIMWSRTVRLNTRVSLLSVTCCRT